CAARSAGTAALFSPAPRTHSSRASSTPARAAPSGSSRSEASTQAIWPGQAAAQCNARLVAPAPPAAPPTPASARVFPPLPPPLHVLRFSLFLRLARPV